MQTVKSIAQIQAENAYYWDNNELSYLRAKYREEARASQYRWGAVVPGASREWEREDARLGLPLEWAEKAPGSPPEPKCDMTLDKSGLPTKV